MQQCSEGGCFTSGSFGNRTRLVEATVLALEVLTGKSKLFLSSVLSREILQEIQRLRLEHEQASQPTPEKAQQNPTLLAELRLLR